MKNLRIMLKKKKKSVPLQNAATFSKCFPLEQSGLQFMKLLAYFNQTEGWEFWKY